MAAGYTQEVLAGRAELHRTQISLLERGLRSPGLDVVVRLIGALGVEPNDLLEGTTWWPGNDGRRGRFSYRRKSG
jgi:transcriptional regulator with XRE-family HTH domain